MVRSAKPHGGVKNNAVMPKSAVSRVGRAGTVPGGTLDAAKHAHRHGGSEEKIHLESSPAAWARTLLTQMRTEEPLPNYHEGHIAGRGDKSLQHYNLVHKFIPMPQAMKIPASKSSSG